LSAYSFFDSRTQAHAPSPTVIPRALNKHLKRLRESKAARNTAASYLAFLSTTVTGLLSIPLAVHYLTKQELGLWAVISAVGGYLSFMELGLGYSTGRKMADGIISKDKVEIDRWWTLSRVVLSIQGVLVVLIGLALVPLFMSVMVGEFPNKGQALFLFIGMVLIQGIKLPFQGAEGILTAQERFHWVPLRQAIIFWVELIVFAGLVVNGFGLYSVFWSKVATLIVVWFLNWWLLAQSEPKLGWDSSGLRWERFRSLFTFTFSVFGVGFMDVFVKSLPVMVLSKMGGLALVPVYTISIKVSTVLVSLGKRNYQSFYPALQRMFIQGHREKFIEKYSGVGLLTVATSLGISGIILGMNRTAVELLAKPEFYAGPVATAWFAVATITIPISGLMQTPLLVAGELGKSVLFAVLRAIIAVFLCALAFREYGTAGLAAVMALLPLVLGAYAYFRGAREFDCAPRKLSGFISLWTLGGILVVMAGGTLLHLFPAEPLLVIKLPHKSVSLPSWLELLVGGGISLSALVLFAYSLNRLRKGGGAKVAEKNASVPQAH
jgi:O-antigen/teichoic acid export membrane protein